MPILRAVIALGLFLALATSATAGPLEDADAADQRGDYASELALLEPLAEQGDASAQYFLGGMYDLGLGVPQDYVQAVAWYRKAAEQGRANAQAALGDMYHLGQGVPQDYVQAAQWYRKAADQGFANNQYNLGVRYRDGKGVNQDYVQAHMLFNLAAAQGDVEAAKARDIVAKLMTPQQVAEAQKLASDWLAAHPKQ